MGNINLLAESRGEERVKPKIIPPIKPSVLTSTVQWKFHSNVNDRIRTFRVICRDGEGKSMDIGEELTPKNVAELKNDSLQLKTTYYVKVVAIYKDGFEAESEECSFLGHPATSKLVTAVYKDNRKTEGRPATSKLVTAVYKDNRKTEGLLHHLSQLTNDSKLLKELICSNALGEPKKVICTPYKRWSTDMLTDTMLLMSNLTHQSVSPESQSINWAESL